jgi:hypothetical protein
VFRVDFREYPDGPADGLVTQSGHTINGSGLVESVDSDESKPAVKDGWYIVPSPVEPVEERRACYGTVDLDEPPDVVVVEMGFGPGTTAFPESGVALIIGKEEGDPSWETAFNSVHMSIGPHGWGIGLLETPGPAWDFSEFFGLAEVPRDFTPVRYRLTRRGNTIYVDQPDGVTVKFTDPRVSRLWGSIVLIECLRDDNPEDPEPRIRSAYATRTRGTPEIRLVGTDSASGNLTLTTTLQDVPGISFVFETFHPDTFLTAVGTLAKNVVTTGFTYLYGVLVVDGVGYPNFILGSETVGICTNSQHWTVFLEDPGAHTIKLQAAKLVNAGAAQVLATHSSLSLRGVDTYD